MQSAIRLSRNYFCGNGSQIAVCGSTI